METEGPGIDCVTTSMMAEAVTVAVDDDVSTPLRVRIAVCEIFVVVGGGSVDEPEDEEEDEEVEEDVVDDVEEDEDELMGVAPPLDDPVEEA